MKIEMAIVVVVTAVIAGCTTVSTSGTIPEQLHYDRINTAFADLGSVRSADEFLRALPLTLSRHGYLVNETRQRPTGGFQLLTEWRFRPVHAKEAFAGVQRARTRLIVDASRRGPSYSLTVYAVSYLEDESGVWREAVVASDEMKKHVRDLGRVLMADVR